ncbi:YopT-type cysteine protease domain-containing protein [Ectopseudomonas toyotomiensis]|uniref:Virulence surface antigen n=1 Tax=Ectopseudomonas toyotomiensis TaxID=554344 RepID=A0A1I5SAB2_9GAMM|nr:MULTISPECIES: YopT-type cysteine protease domain-containing protein [Pseudomonas]SDA79099.1 virulence surface antigen [Pseudomonas sp. NFPP33]SFP67639.1 virulence surface antigen [Pseudomonas toyotomiensis]
MFTPIFEIDQELWTRSGSTIDIQMDAGICFALCHEWCSAQAKRDYANIELFFSTQFPAMHRLFSLQRGFNLVSDSLTQGAGYANFYAVDENLTTSMLTRDARRSAINVTVACRTQAPGIIQNLLNTCYKGDTFLLGFWGVENGENWGHVVGVSWPPNKGKAYFFDPNLGLFREEITNQLGIDTMSEIDNLYNNANINDFTLYEYRKI